MGSALGGMLAHRHDVTLVGRKPHVDRIRRRGLRLTGDISCNVRVRAVDNPSDVQVPDLLLVSTKAYDTPSAIDACKNVVDDDTTVLTLQNGLGNLELLREWKGDAAFGGVTTMGAALTSPGIVCVSGLGMTTIGADKDSSRAREIAGALSSCGIRAEVKKDIVREIWGKAVINACINPTAAILGVRNGKLLESGTTTRFMREVCHECEEVASASSVSLPSRRMYPRVRAVCSDTAFNISSMLQDVRRGKRTEIGQINGAFCSYGEARGVPTPLNRTLVAIIEPLQLFAKGERLIS